MNYGTSRNERASNSLNPSNFKLDGRSLTELYEEAKIFAKSVVYEEGDLTGNWEHFFEEGEAYIKRIEKKSLQAHELKDCPPHLGLFIAFLQLFQSVQEQFNSLSAAHLKFFYQKILAQEAFKMKEDHAYVFLELARNTAKFYLEKGTKLLAGKDAHKKDIIYTTDRDLFLNKAVVSETHAIYNSKSAKDSLCVFKNVSELQQVLGEKVNADGTGPVEGWYPFGNPNLLRESARLGFGVSAPILMLNEGQRTIQIRLALESKQEVLMANTLDTNLLEAHLSTKDGWMVKPIQQITMDGNELAFEIVLDKLDPALQVPEIPWEEVVFKKIKYPIVKIVLKQGYSFQHYAVLNKIKMNSLSIDVKVVGMESLGVKNDFGVLDIKQNLQPFGFIPTIGANFYISAPELVLKDTKSVSLTLHWKALPENIKSYYEGYKGEINSLVEKKEDFKVNISQRKNKEWIQIQNGTDPLFNLFEEHLQLNNSIAETEGKGNRSADPDNGTLKITLTAPSDAFGHNIYPAVYTRAIMAQIQQKDAPIPNQPYTPTVEMIQLNYEASETFDMNNRSVAEQHLFHIEPFGANMSIASQSPFSLISPNYNDGGQLYLGITELHPPEQLSLFFEIKEENVKDKPAIELAYLSTTGWKVFSKNQLLSDATLGLRQTGIIMLNIPADASDSNGVMPQGLFWIKLAIPEFPERFDRILNIKTNAVRCTLNTTNINEGFEVNQLPPGSIKSFLKKKGEIKKIVQPYGSFGGVTAESDTSYFTRVSEQLAHKNRGVTAWDIEHLVLQNFPEIYQVICNRNMDAYGIEKAGYMHLIVIPRVVSLDANTIRKPLASSAMLYRIKEFVKTCVSPHVQLSVGNPIYEELKISASVSFKDKVDAGFYIEKLENDIKKYLSPWAFSSGQKIEMGTSFYTSALIKFIELQPYINFVASVKISKDNKNLRANEIRAGKQAILVSSNRHNIQTVAPNTVMCQTNQGIAQMIVDINFQIE